MPTEIVPGMAEKIEERRLELDLSLGDFASQAGLTRQGLAPYRKGERRNYNDQAKRGVARALRWRHDAIDRLLAGVAPVALEDEFLESRHGSETAIPGGHERRGRRMAEQQRRMTTRQVSQQDRVTAVKRGLIMKPSHVRLTTGQRRTLTGSAAPQQRRRG